MVFLSIHKQIQTNFKDITSLSFIITTSNSSTIYIIINLIIIIYTKFMVLLLQFCLICTSYELTMLDKAFASSSVPPLRAMLSN